MKSGSGRVTPRPRRVKRSEVRRRILESADRLFRERGLAATSLEAIAKAAGFSKGAVYSNFAGKDELCFELLSSRIDARIAAVEGAMPAEAGPAHHALLAGERLLRIVESEPGWQIFFIELWLRCVRSESLRPRFAAKRKLMRAQIASLFAAQADAAGFRLPLPAEHLAASVLALSNGLGLESLIDSEAVPPDLMGKLMGWSLRGMIADTQDNATRR